MPVYCYKCFDCNYYDEIKQNMEDEPLNICPECGSDQYKRVIRNVGIIFKGSGFHVNDYGRGKVLPKGESAQSSTAAKTETTAPEKTEVKTESKPEKKEPAKTATSDAK